MPRDLRHRHALAIPFLVLAVVTLLGGLLNGVTARGRLVDDFTGDGVAGTVTHGSRSVATGEDGTFEMDNVPRTSRLRVNAGGYLQTGAPPIAGEVRLQPLTVTFIVNAEGTSAQPQPERVGSAQIRQGSRILGTTNTSGNASVSPHPGRDAVVIVCAKDFETKEVAVRGVLMTVELAKRPGSDCPPLPTPSPVPSPSPTAGPSPTAPAPTPSPTGAP